MSSIFSRLVSYSPHEGKSHMEDFTTELLVGMLQKSSELKEKFIKYIIGGKLDWDISINQENLSDWIIETQHTILNGQRPDIVIKNEVGEVKFFIEHKIDSVPYFEGQLTPYSEEINSIKEGVGLILLTKYYAPVDNEDVACPFRTVWWRDLFDFFDKVKLVNEIEKDYLREFKQYLKDNKMDLRKKFEPADVSSLVRIQELFTIMDKVIGSSKINNKIKTFKIGKSSEQATRSSQVQWWGRYVSYNYFLTKFDDEIGILYGFSFNEFNYLLVPKEEGFNDKLIAYISVEADPKKVTNFTNEKLFEFVKNTSEWNKSPANSNRWGIISRAVDVATLQGESHIDLLIEWFADGFEQMIQASLVKDLKK